MSDTAMIALFVIASAWTILLFWKSFFEKTIAAVLLMLIFGAGFAQTVIPVRFVLALAALTVIVTLTLKYRATLRPKVFRAVSITSTSCLVAYGTLQLFVQSEMLDPLFRYTVLFPLMFLAGYVASNLNLGVVVSKLYVLTGLTMAALAVVERIQNSFLLAGNYENAGRLVRDGAIRSIVGAEHPLVLSVLLVAAIPLVQVTVTSLVLRTGAFVLLIAGIVSTNSRGALVLVCMWFVITAALKSKIFGRAHTSLIQFFAAASLVVGLIWMLTGSGSDSLSSTSAVDASAEYRSSLYLFAAQSLVEQPWGWGLSGLPVGVYVVASYFGSLDIAMTIDSEVALLMFDFGWLGVLGFVSMASFLLRAGRLNSPLGQAALLLSASGFYLALHSWSGLGSAWFLLLGLAVTYGVTKPNSAPVEDDNHSFNGVSTKSVMNG